VHSPVCSQVVDECDLQKVPLDTAGLEDSDDDGPPAALSPTATAQAPSAEHSVQKDKEPSAFPDQHASIASRIGTETSSSPAISAVLKSDVPDAADTPAQAVGPARVSGKETVAASDASEEEEAPEDKVLSFLAQSPQTLCV
jgi:hypothetical protein